MKRVAAAFAAASVLAGVVWTEPASAAATTRRIIVVLADGASVGSWQRDATVRPVIEAGSSALLSVRAGGGAREPAAAREAAMISLGAGRRSTDAVDALALGGALSGAAIPVFGSRAARVLGGADLPALDALPRPSVAFVDAAAEPRCAVRCVDEAREALAPGDVLILVSPVPSQNRLRDGLWLSAIGVLVSGSPSGLLRSPTTRRDGVVALIDVAPSILSLAGVRVPDSMDGRPFERVESASPGSSLLALEQDLVGAARARRPATRAWMIAAMLALGAATLVVLGRGPSALRVVTEVLLAALPAMPGALLLVPLLPPLSPAATTIAAGTIALAAGGAVRVFRQGAEAVATTAMVSAAVAVADLAAGGWLAARSPVSFLVSGGLRFYGLGNELMGVVLAGAVAAGSMLGRARMRGAARLVVPLVAALVVGLMAAPSAGAKLGSVFVAVPALAVLVAGLAGQRLTLRLWAAIGVFTVAVAGAVYVTDRLRAAEVRSHIGEAGSGGLGDVVARKIEAALGIAALSIWMQALLVCLVVAFTVWRLRRVELQALLTLRPGVGAGLKAGAVAVVLAPATNDAGLIASAIIAVTVSGMLLTALGDEAGVRLRGSRDGPGFAGSGPARPG